ncbi:hypothetical protein [Allorhizobium terrae]|uniref:hypothetical protein n=1 Tax=Allorhizobium terrae TaxID=1848972 RepID=UPI001E38A5BC|nr:hypothetical protein [Allorhizobium terrae]
MKDQPVKAIAIKTARRLVRVIAAWAISVVGETPRFRNQNIIRTPHKNVNNSGTHTVNSKGAEWIWVIDKAQLLDSKMKYIIGI